MRADAVSDVRNAVMPTYARADVTLVEGEGSWLTADDGRRFLDFAGGIAVVGARPRAPCAARRRARAARPALARVEPLLDRADEQARRAAVRALRRRGVVLLQLRAPRRTRRRSSTRARRPASRGSSRSRARSTGARPARSPATGQPAKRAAFEPLLPGVTFAQLNDTASLEAAVGPDTGLILIEPVQGEGGVLPATPGFLAAAAELAAEHGALLCFDEVQTGVGRTGTFFAFEQLGVRPAPRHAREGARERPADRRAARRRRRAGRARARRPRVDLRRQPGRRAPPPAPSSRPSTRSCSRTSANGARSSRRRCRCAAPACCSALETADPPGDVVAAASTRACSSPRPARPRLRLTPPLTVTPEEVAQAISILQEVSP